MASQITFGSLPSWPLGPQDNTESATNPTSASVGTTKIFPQGPGTATPAGQTGTLFRRVLVTPSTQSSSAPSNTGDPSLPPPLELPDLPTPTGVATPSVHAKNARLELSKDQQRLNNPPPRLLFQGRHKRSKLSAETMEQVNQQSLDQLRRTVAKDPEYLRLTVADKLQLDAAYRAYQTAVHRIAIENKLHIKPVLDYLGNEARIRGPSCYNNFCKYDPISGAINRDKTIPSTERASKCGSLWRQLTREEQAQWKDQEYLDSLPAHIEVESTTTDVNNPTGSATSAPAPRTLPRDRFSLKRWAHKVKRELRNLSTAHQVEGYLVLASRDPIRPVLITGGSHMGEEFLDILASDTNQCNSFFNFVSGKQAVKDVSGRYPPSINPRKRRRGVDGDDPNCPHDLGSKKANTNEVRKLLRDALSKATHGAWQNGWPGTKTAAKLRQLGVTLSVQDNDQNITAADFCKRPSDMFIGQTQRILLAFSKGWVKITGPPQPGLSSIGLNPNEDEESGSGSEVNEATSSRPKKALPKRNAPPAKRSAITTTKAVYPRIGKIRKPRTVRKRRNASASSSSSEEEDHYSTDSSSDGQTTWEQSADTNFGTPCSAAESAIAALA
ncbi:uncharacterized protein PGTG_10852 [Puccinia graminis f. sp. tritici CRL 75-36-700-3]|uniref:Uncharacterized protein n=1 Tax=Puccinia graminis f. sp. tritici (strain CRL 75-36-700-3 / race SCCL) TaxID=418459 RepID=E3KK68_PUCGT|nr:uncharacterized protein PGTG_10852 [Puccinia graminis f. sp. tritici CRL 75-36-700-3]EFP84693.1 hypothetical protein PGTG_10852 [Puccinia graminis f. sp. tritici CRL 75-36-700-3]